MRLFNAFSLKNVPNLVTSLRIIGTAVLIFIKPLTPLFFVVYTITGLTDVLDGFLARRLKLTSDFGARLDSIADLMFYTVMLIMLIPILLKIMPISIWYFLIVVLIFRICSYVTAAVKFHKFAAKHSKINKITGFLVFSIPYIILYPYAITICYFICFIGLIGSVTEFIGYLKSTQD